MNLLGKRQPAIYGHETLADVEAECRHVTAELRLEIEFKQSNAESQLIDWIHEARERACGIVINPAAFAAIMTPARIRNANKMPADEASG